MSYGPVVNTIASSLDVAAIPIAGNVTVYSKAFPLKYGAYFALAYKATTGAGAIDLTIQLEQSYQLPTTEGAADSTYVVPTSMSDIHTNLADQNWHNTSLSPAAMPYARLKIAGGATNNASVTLQVKFCMLEQD